MLDFLWTADSHAVFTEHTVYKVQINQIFGYFMPCSVHTWHKLFAQQDYIQSQWLDENTLLSLRPARMGQCKWIDDMKNHGKRQTLELKILNSSKFFCARLYRRTYWHWCSLFMAVCGHPVLYNNTSTHTKKGQRSKYFLCVWSEHGIRLTCHVNQSGDWCRLFQLCRSRSFLHGGWSQTCSWFIPAARITWLTNCTKYQYAKWSEYNELNDISVYLVVYLYNIICYK